MKRAIILKKFSLADRYKIKLNEWNDLCKAYAKDTPFELMNVYKKLTGEKERDAKKFKTHRGCFDDTFYYIYNINDILYYGKDQKEYPLFDESLWPWTVKTKLMPYLHKDIYQSLTLHMKPRDIINFALVNKMAYTASRSEVTWRKYYDWMYDNVILSRPLLKTFKIWQLYVKMLSPYQPSFRNVPFLMFSINLMIPLGDRIAVLEQTDSSAILRVDESKEFGFKQETDDFSISSFYINDDILGVDWRLNVVFTPLLACYLFGNYTTAYKKSTVYEYWEEFRELFEIEEESGDDENE
jgi:hypothetical protein